VVGSLVPRVANTPAWPENEAVWFAESGRCKSQLGSNPLQKCFQGSQGQFTLYYQGEVYDPAGEINFSLFFPQVLRATDPNLLSYALLSDCHCSKWL